MSGGLNQVANPPEHHLAASVTLYGRRSARRSVSEGCASAHTSSEATYARQSSQIHERARNSDTKLRRIDQASLSQTWALEIVGLSQAQFAFVGTVSIAKLLHPRIPRSLTLAVLHDLTNGAQCHQAKSPKPVHRTDKKPPQHLLIGEIYIQIHEAMHQRFSSLVAKPKANPAGSQRTRGAMRLSIGCR